MSRVRSTSSREQEPSGPAAAAEPAAGHGAGADHAGADRGGAGTGPGAPPASPALVRAARLNAGNMVRSLLPLVLLCLAIVGWVALRQTPEDPVSEVDPSSTVRLAAERAGYALEAPAGLPEGYRPTSARTDAGRATDGDPVTLEIGYFTPGEEFAGFVIGDDRRAQPLAGVLDGAEEQGQVEIDGRTWTRGVTARGETVLTLAADGATVLVTGSAADAELTEVAAAVEPYSG